MREDKISHKTLKSQITNPMIKIIANDYENNHCKELSWTKNYWIAFEIPSNHEIIAKPTKRTRTSNWSRIKILYNPQSLFGELNNSNNKIDHIVFRLVSNVRLVRFVNNAFI